MGKKPSIDPTDDMFGTVLNCAVRYAIGRESYMPGLVIDFIRPLLSQLPMKTLWCMERDINEQSAYGERAYGSPDIDKPAWIEFLKQIQSEIVRRKQNG